MVLTFRANQSIQHQQTKGHEATELNSIFNTIRSKNICTLSDRA